MARKSIKEQLQSEVEMAMAEVTECRDKVGYWQERLTTAENELDRLRGALDALEGRFTVTDLRSLPITTADEANKAPNGFRLAPLPSPVGTPQPQTVKIGDEEIILEPGFKVAKNSLGEDCIVPEGLDLKPMAEPVKPVGALGADGEYLPAKAISLPPVTPEDSFSSPEDFLNG